MVVTLWNLVGIPAAINNSIQLGDRAKKLRQDHPKVFIAVIVVSGLGASIGIGFWAMPKAVPRLPDRSKPIATQQVVPLAGGKTSQSAPTAPSAVQPAPSSPPPNSSVTIVRNQGTIDRTKVANTTVKGMPPPNSGITIVQNDRNSKMRELSVDHTNLDFRDPGPIPPPSAAETTADEPALSYQKRVNNLINDMRHWQETDQKGFHKAFGKQILLLASQLRNCNFRDLHDFYGRTKLPPKIAIDQLVLLDVESLTGIAAQLPDDDRKLTCADSGRSLADALPGGS